MVAFSNPENDPLMKNGNGNYVYFCSGTAPPAKAIPAKRKIKRVAYSAGNHIQVLFQMHGSALPQVLPFCIVNVLWTCLIYHLQREGIADLAFKSGTGHTFMGLLVSFLVVSRSTISYHRFMEIRRHLAETYRSCREISQFTCVYTFKTKTPKAIEWRQDMAYRTILLLRVTMDTLRWSSENLSSWERSYNPEDKASRRLSSFSHGNRTLVDENFRASIMFSHILRELIMKHPEALGYTLHANEYRDLLHFVTAFNKAFHGFRVLIFTPYPFPLVQMTRMFLFFWVFSIPLVLVQQMESLWDTVVVVFFITFGFVGTEYVSMTLDDPFGNDANDIDEQGMAELVFEDIYFAICRTDGPVAAKKVRDRVLERYMLGRGLDCFHHDMQTSFWSEMQDDVSSFGSGGRGEDYPLNAV
jgi:predicted membrane chloride channel (bestrophin family)